MFGVVAFASGVIAAFLSFGLGETLASGEIGWAISVICAGLVLPLSAAGLSLRASEEEMIAGSFKGPEAGVGAGDGVCATVGRRPGGVYLLDRPLGARGGYS